MKKFYLLFIVSALPLFVGYAQDSNEALRSYLEYSNLILKKDFDKALDYVHAGIFEIAPRDQMKQILEQTFNNPMMEIEMTKPEIKGVSAIKEIDKTYYLKFNSNDVVKMRFSPQAIGEGDEAVAKVRQGLEAQFGQANVSYDSTTRFFSISTLKPVIAASTDKKTWKFVTIDNEQLIPMLEKFIPKEVLDMKVD